MICTTDAPSIQRQTVLHLFDSVEVDLIAPPELMMPEHYLAKMKENGYTVRLFDSIEEYLGQDHVSSKWYFTRPQLERMGERILKNQQNLRKKVSWTGKLDFRLPEGTKFYHPLPRHRIHPTIPTEVDGTSLNGYERQSINGMYVRITLLAMLAGKIGDDYTGLVNVTENQDKEEYIVNVTSVQMEAPGTSQRVSEGVNPIRNGIVIDHIGKGESPSTIRRSMALIIKVLNLADERGGEWVSTSNSAEGAYKGYHIPSGSE